MGNTKGEMTSWIAHLENYLGGMAEDGKPCMIEGRQWEKNFTFGRIRGARTSLWQ